LPLGIHRIYNLPVSRASALFRLQQADLAIDQGRDRLAAIDAELGQDAVLRQARERAGRAEEARGAAARAVREGEAEVQDQRRKIEEAEGKLYGGAVQNPKELQELQAEADSLRRHLSTIEDRLLERMVELERTEGEADARRADLELAEADRSGRNRSLEEEQEKLRESLERRTQEREAATAGIEPADMELYMRLRQNLGGLAIVEMIEDSCGACGLTLGSSENQEVRSGANLLRCKQCGRILYAG
jgi:predicted  nucleic acid-binding Zn-ribbon protein